MNFFRFDQAGYLNPLLKLSVDIPLSRKVNCGGSAIAERLMHTLMTVKLKVVGERGFRLLAIDVLAAIHFLVLHAPPKSFNEHVVQSPTTAVHAHRNARRLQA